MIESYDLATILVGMGTTCAIAAAGIAFYQMFTETKRAPGIVMELNEQYSEDMPLQEVYCLYNRLLPTSRRTRGETRNLADGLVDKVELRLCQHIAEEGYLTLDRRLIQSPTFSNTFAQHHYAGKSNPEGAVNHVLDVMAKKNLLSGILPPH